MLFNNLRRIFIFLGVMLPLESFCQPSACTNPVIVGGAGATTGGDFTLDPYYCLNSGTATITVAPIGSSGGAYIYSYGITNTGTPILTTDKSIVVSSANVGTYWVLQGINDSNTGQNKIFCKSTTIYDTPAPMVKVCSNGLTVTLNFPVDPANKYQMYEIDWGDGNGVVPVTATSYPFNKSFSYTSLGNKTIKITGAYTLAANPLTPICKGQTVTQNYTPTASTNLYIDNLEMISGGNNVKVSFKNYDPSLSNYTLHWQPKATGPWLLAGMATAGTATSTMLNTIDPSVKNCFRIEGQDACGTAIQSLPVCSISAKAQALSSQLIQVDWNSPSTGTVVYSLSRQEGSAAPTSVAPSPNTYNQYIDTPVKCGTQYIYKVSGTYKDANGNSVTSIAAPQSATPTSGTSNLTAKPPWASVTVINNKSIKYIFNDNTIESAYKIERNVDTTPKVWSVVSTNNSYDDNNVDPLKHRYCYRISYSDGCGNWSPPSAALCNIVLTSDDPTSLTWTPLTDDPRYASLVTYSVIPADPNTGTPIGNPVVNNQASTKFITNILGSTGQNTFIVQANLSLSSFPYLSLSNTYTFQIPAELYIPTAFTPNNDTNNDEFIIHGKFVQDFQLIIYDQWGSPIFESNDINKSWDGTLPDRVTLAPIGNYAYAITITDTHGQQTLRTGTVAVLR